MGEAIKTERIAGGPGLSSRQQSRRLALLALGGGTLAALGQGLGRLPGLAEGRAATDIVLWAADRAGHAVYGLDRGMIVRSRVPVAAPHALRVRSDGGVEARSAVDGIRRGRHRWVSIAPGRDLRTMGAWGAPRAAGGSPWLERGPWGDAPWKGAPETSEPTPPDLAQLAGPRAWRVRGTRRRLRAWALLERRGESRLERWVRDERGSSPRWERAFAFAPGFDARLMAADDLGVWVAAHRRGAYVRVNNRGETIARPTLSDVGGADAMVALPPTTQAGWEGPGTVAIAAGGALVRLNGQGRRLPGQGGFGHLVALAAPLSCC